MILAHRIVKGSGPKAGTFIHFTLQLRWRCRSHRQYLPRLHGPRERMCGGSTAVCCSNHGVQGSVLPEPERKQICLTSAVLTETTCALAEMSNYRVTGSLPKYAVEPKDKAHCRADPCKPIPVTQPASRTPDCKGSRTHHVLSCCQCCTEFQALRKPRMKSTITGHGLFSSYCLAHLHPVFASRERAP